MTQFDPVLLPALQDLLLRAMGAAALALVLVLLIETACLVCALLADGSRDSADNERVAHDLASRATRGTQGTPGPAHHNASAPSIAGRRGRTSSGQITDNLETS